MTDVKSLKIDGVNIMDIIYPVGSIYETMDSSFNPSKSFGGTWERIKGKVIVGVDEYDTDFESSRLTGGEKSHKLTINEIPSHDHHFRNNSHTVSWGDQSSNVYFSNTQAVAGRPPQNNPSVRQSTWTITELSGYDGEHNNLQPYITCYIWQRIS